MNVKQRGVLFEVRERRSRRVGPRAVEKKLKVPVTRAALERRIVELEARLLAIEAQMMERGAGLPVLLARLEELKRRLGEGYGQLVADSAGARGGSGGDGLEAGVS